ncbi:MAG: DNA primase [Firmicutes bacterium]|nr:DNA primase [Bacillota bacterium]
MDKKNDFYDELLAKTDIVRLISEYVPLSKKGASYWGCCPFHHEKTPSFSVSEEKQFYHCFGCGVSGNAFTFIKKIESVEFGDALRILAKKAGMEVPEFKSGPRVDEAEILKKKERLYQLMRDAARRYHENLTSGQAGEVREYLKNRGVDEKLTRKFGLGYAVNSSDMVSHLTECGYTPLEMKDAGITAVNEKGAYDVFYDRLIVPIINQLGEVVAFGGRTLQKNPSFAKYRNSSQTLIFDKSKTIYAVNLLQKRKQQKAAVEYVILCEGYMDVIALHTAGFDTAVASMGTALTFNQAKQLKNFSPRVLVSYDGDAAGQKATLRSLDILEEAGLAVRVVRLPDGLDPDDVVRKMGPQAYQSLLDAAIPLPAFKIEALKKQFDLSEPEGKSKFAVEAAKVIKALKNPVEQEEYLALVKDATGYSMEALRRQTDVSIPPPGSRRTGPQPPDARFPVGRDGSLIAPPLSEEPPVYDADGSFDSAPPKPSSGGKAGAAAKRFVLASLAAQKEYVDFSANFEAFLSDSFSREVAMFFIANRKQKSESLAGLFYRAEEFCAEGELNEILHYPFIEGDNAEKYAGCVLSLTESTLKKEKENLAQTYISADPQHKKEILARLAQVDDKLKQLKNKE